MPITRINTFQARAAQGDALRALLASFIPLIEAAEGCHSCELLQQLDDPTQLVVLEVWESTEAHQASVKSIPPDAMAAAMTFLAAPPTGAYYRS